jgi:hypothetical protein
MSFTLPSLSLNTLPINSCGSLNQESVDKCTPKKTQGISVLGKRALDSHASTLLNSTHPFKKKSAKDVDENEKTKASSEALLEKKEFQQPIPQSLSIVNTQKDALSRSLQPQPSISSMQFQAWSCRPMKSNIVKKLSTDILRTYQHINEIYYSKKEDRLPSTNNSPYAVSA